MQGIACNNEGRIHAKHKQRYAGPCAMHACETSDGVVYTRCQYYADVDRVCMQCEWCSYINGGQKAMPGSRKSMLACVCER